MSRINVDITEMQSALADMQTAISQFKTISEGAFLSEINALDAMKSDLADAYVNVLECMKGWGTEGLAQNIEVYYQDANAILNTLIAEDEATSREIRGITYGRA